MKLKLENFRCHKKANFDIPNTGLVLLSGASGAGKTTILNAITYALYGKLAKPYSHNQTKCSVTLEGYCIPGSAETLNIVRTSPGSRLKVTYSGKDYEDDAAQGVVDNLTVPYEKFLLSSYVVQRINSSILSLSPRDQVFFIKTLASVGDCNNAFRARIKEKIGHYEARANHLKGEISAIKRHLDSVGVSPHPPPQIEILPDQVRSTIQRLEREINMSRETIGQLGEDKTRLQGEIGQTIQATTLEEQMVALKKQLAKNDFCDDSEFEKLENELSFFKRADAFRTEIFNLKRLQVDLVHKKTLKAGLLSPEARETYQKEVENLRDEHKKAAAAAAAVANAKKEISNISEEVSTKWKKKLKKGPAALQDFFEKKPRHLKKLAEQVRQEIHDLSQKEATYTCPSCDTPLILEDRKLTRVQHPSDAPATPVDYAPLILTSREKLIQIEKDLATLNVLGSQFSLVVEQIKPKVLPASKLDLFLKKIEKLEKTILISEKNRQELDSITATEKILADHRAKAETILHEGDKEKLEALGDVDLRPHLDRTIETLTRLRVNKEKVVALSAEIQAKQLLLDQNQPVSPNVSDDLDRVVAQLEECQTQQRDRVMAFQRSQKELEEALEYQTYKNGVSLLKESDELEVSLNSTFDKILGFQGLNVLCKKADIVASDSTIADINFNASFYTKELFAEPIQISLSRVRTTLKGEKRDGMTANVVYMGSEYSSLDQLSGGERQRGNLAFILAVNDIVGSPFLLLDECLNNLDGETHAAILDFLGQTCRGKLILVVAHEAATAKFDEVVLV